MGTSRSDGLLSRETDVTDQSGLADFEDNLILDDDEGRSLTDVPMDAADDTGLRLDAGGRV